MAIDIKNVSSGKISTGATSSSKKIKNSSIADSDSDGDSSTDSVELTGKAAQIGSLIQKMMAMPAVDYSRVEPVKEKVDNGSYEVEAERVADKMLDFEAGYSRVR
ncbi:MAG: flagellar biosynthesis anti-sigma factor FlgM [Gammaproteobacteria bacterium]|nr:flagellar biosynthesis anti-sigma factor FlgM [Gammaproteobacteria bacterium]